MLGTDSSATEEDNRDGQPGSLNWNSLLSWSINGVQDVTSDGDSRNFRLKRVPHKGQKRSFQSTEDCYKERAAGVGSIQRGFSELGSGL